MKVKLFSLYTQFLSGKISKDQFIELRDDINKLNNNQLGDMMHSIWNESKHSVAIPSALNQFIKSNLNFYVDAQQRSARRRFIRIVSIAASVVFIISASLLYFSSREPLMSKQFSVNVEIGQKASVRLPDNTNVQLNSDTELYYDTNDDKQRKVVLNGEAFFEVKKDANRPFIIDLGDLEVEVLGTSFNVKKYKNDLYIKTLLVEGQIKLTNKKENNVYYLNPMEELTYNQSTKSVEVVKVKDKMELDWRYGRLVFESEPLNEVIKKIERWYGVTINMPYSSIENDLMSGSFHKESLQSVLEAIRIQYGLDYIIKENQIAFKKK